MKTIYLLLICCLLTVGVQGQDYTFKKLRVEDGLSHNAVVSMLQDQRGFLWFGTKDGLNRYDGYNFKLFQYEAGNDKSLGSNFIRCLHEYDGYLWVGTDTGLFRYEELTESFTPVESTLNQPVLDIEGDLYGNLWFIASGNLYRLNTRTGKEEKFSRFSVTFLTGNEAGEVFVASSEALYRFVPDNNSFQKIDFTEGPYAGEDLEITALSAGGKDTLWIGTKNRGAMVYRESVKQLTALLQERENPLYVRDFLKKGDDELWIASESGLYIYNLRTKNYKNLKKSYNNPYSLSDNAIYTLVLDKEEGVWIGTYFGGINYYPKPYTPIARYFPRVGENSISGNAVREIKKDRYGDLWIGTEDAGLNRFDPETGTFENFSSVGEKGPLSNYNIHGLLPVDDKLWIGTFEHGLDIMDIPSRRIVRHYGSGDDEGHLRSDFIFFIYEGRNSDIYVLTSSGIHRYLPGTDTFEVVEGFPEEYHYTYLTEDHNGVLWAGTYWDGLFFYDPKTGDKGVYRYAAGNPDSISSNVVNGIFEDSENRLWITTENGLNLFRRGTSDFRRFSKKDGFPANVTYSILEDENKKLWISTSNGLVEFDPETEKLKIFTKANGLLSDQFNYSSAFKDEDGEMYFGGVYGMISFNPDTFLTDNSHPPVYLTGMRLHNREVPVGAEDSPLEKSISFSDHITLDPGESTFTLEFASLSYTAPGMTRYWYKLEGLNDDWIALEKKHEVNFTELPAGEYSFKVKALNNHGVWSGENNALRIKVLPPFLASPAAYTIYTLMFLLMVYLLLQYYHSYTKHKNNRKIRQLENEKEKEIYQAKIEFFTNIAHEIRTPLTLITAPLEKLLGKTYRSPEIPKNLGIMQKNTSRLLNLVNELLDFRKTEMKHVKLSFIKVNISELLEDTYVRFSQLIQEKGLLFDLVKPEGDVYASVDEEAIKKILSNLFSNAVKYSKSRVKVSLEQHETKFSIQVENDGPVIPAPLKKRIFEPFFRLPGDAGNTGTGIGLSLAHSLAELHGGTLYIDENKQSVNAFVLEVPLHQAEEFKTLAAGHEQADTAREHAIPAFDKKLPLILIAEDNKEMAGFIREELSDSYNVILAPNGKEAWDLVRDHEVQLVISDVMMPLSDGVTLCKRIKERMETSHIPVILLTAKSALNARIEGLESGADAYISKPFSIHYLRVQVSNLLKNRKTILGHYSSSPLAHLKSLATSNVDKSFITRLDKVIDKNIRDPELNIDLLAENLHMSRSTLYRKIKEVSNLSPHELINISRLKKAAELLKTTDMKIYEVSESVGYKSQTSFGRNFQKHFGMTPTEYVNDGMEKAEKKSV
ncbi:Signal transduction histidine kinase [Sinomicrobium oceani]|uniref:histidine kinase n=1 Tax=Sinomicrobium oceani TaxID=1150368 RepID=A0A1K1PUX0_9FLAO|nr:two-component regulator propeller domain-containing protein [Sinomicrobium oceani]SFW50598.1 Signal transduction histidine kinase [Sinomicrobium oceani]